MANPLIESVIHWRKKLEKHTDEETVLNVIRKLSKVPMTLEILEETHIGRCIRQLSKKPDIVGEKALTLLRKWRSSFAGNDEPHSKGSSKSSSSSKSKKENLHKNPAGKSSSKIDSRCDTPKVIERKSSFSNSENRHKKVSGSLKHSHDSSKYSEKKLRPIVSEQSSPSPNPYENACFEQYEAVDSHSGFNEGYNPECPELYAGSQLKSSKIKVPDSVGSLYKPTAIKRQLSSDEEIETKIEVKKHKSRIDSVVEDSASEIKYKSKKKEKHSSPAHKDASHISSKSESREKSKHRSSDLKESKKDSEKKSSSETKKGKVKINTSEEFTSSEVRFEDCLGFNDIVVKKKSKKAPTASNKKPLSSNNEASTSSSTGKGKEHKRTDKSKKEKSLFELPKNEVSIDEVDIMSTLPEIQPNYRPLPPRFLDSQEKKKKVLSNEEAIKFTSSRKEKTNVYSGRKSFFTEVPSLSECCTRVLMDNIDAIEYMGGVPYFLLKSVLERCTPEQLFAIEHYNPYLLEDTHELWEIHCKRDYRLLTPQENETWRELYLRAQEEREKKLRSVTANISASMSKSNPVRQVKLAYVDSVAKPPRDVARRQAKHGTGLPVSHVMKPGPPSKASPTPTAPVINSTLSSRATTSSVIPKTKPKVAPLMAKTLKSMKLCFRR